MNERIVRMRKEIEQRGGRVYINENLPDAITERFLREILACPHCLAQTLKENHAGRESPGH